jgi:hypothetical protein
MRGANSDGSEDTPLPFDLPAVAVQEDKPAFVWHTGNPAGSEHAGRRRSDFVNAHGPLPARAGAADGVGRK